MKAVIFWLWQLPQHVLALLVWAALAAAGRVLRVEKTDEAPGNVFVTTRTPRWGISLGRYVFLDAAYDTQTRRHERGHSWQSLFLGPLYLLAVGLPSAVGNNLWDRMFHKNWTAERRIDWYYSRYPEAGADRLGGVERWTMEGQ